MESNLKIQELRSIDTTKVEWYLVNELRCFSTSYIYPAYAIAYVIIKDAETDTSDLSSMDSFVRTCSISDEIAGFISDNLNGIWDIVARAKGMFDIDTYKAFLMFDDISDMSTGLAATPDSITRLAIRLLNVKSGEHVADFFTGRGAFIRECYLTEPSAQYWGTDISNNCKIIANIRAEMLDESIEVESQDIISMECRKQSFDKIFANYPFAVRVSVNESTAALRYINQHLSLGKRGISLDWLTHISMIKMLKDNGIAFTITTMGTLFRENEKEFRKYFVENGYINSIIALPSGLFEYAKGLSTVALIFSNHNSGVRYIDARQIFTKGRRYNTLSDSDIDQIMDLCHTDSSISRAVSVHEIAANDYNLDVGRYFGEEISISNGVPFETVIKKITRGAQLKAAQLDGLSSTEPTKYQYLTLSDIQNGQISEHLSFLTGIENNLIKYCAKNNSLIITKSGSPIKTAVVNVPDDKMILSTGNMYVIELNEDMVNPYFLKAFLDSDKGMRALQSVCAVTVIPNIPIDALKQMVIPLPDMNVQNSIAKQYLDEANRIKTLRVQLNEAEEHLKTIYSDNY